MSNLNIGASLNTVSTLVNLPVDKGVVYATLSGPSVLSLAEPMLIGQTLELVINPTASFTQPIPSINGWSSLIGETVKTIPNVKISLTLTCNGISSYVIGGPYSTENTLNGYEYVDLGLPSGVKWAKYNIGSDNIGEVGKFFQWGDTVGHYSGGTESERARAYSFWSTCPFNNGNEEYNSQYFSTVSGTVCPNRILAAEYDAATVNMGPGWRMPTVEDFQELINYTYVGNNGVGFNTDKKFSDMGRNGGYAFISPNGNSLLLMGDNGYESGNTISNISKAFWTSNLYPANYSAGVDNYAHVFRVQSGTLGALGIHQFERLRCCNIRAVCGGNNN